LTLGALGKSGFSKGAAIIIIIITFSFIKKNENVMMMMMAASRKSLGTTRLTQSFISFALNTQVLIAFQP